MLTHPAFATLDGTRNRLIFFDIKKETGQERCEPERLSMVRQHPQLGVSVTLDMATYPIEQSRNKILDGADQLRQSRLIKPMETDMTAHAHATDGEAIADASITLKLLWQETMADRKADYSAFSPVYKGAVGRIFRFEAGEMQGLWLWSMTADGYDISRNVGQCSGHQTSPRRAAKCVEEAWFAAIHGSSLYRAESRNAYAAAKSGE